MFKSLVVRRCAVIGGIVPTIVGWRIVIADETVISERVFRGGKATGREGRQTERAPGL